MVNQQMPGHSMVKLLVRLLYSVTIPLFHQSWKASSFILNPKRRYYICTNLAGVYLKSTWIILEYVSSILSIRSKIFSQSADEKSEAKMAKIDVQCLCNAKVVNSLHTVFPDKSSSLFSTDRVRNQVTSSCFPYYII